MDGSLKLLYIAPETLLRTDDFEDYWFLNFLVSKARINHIVLDEAHATVESSQDFRPKYRLLGILKEYFEDVGVSCLTATASPSDILEIVKNLKLKDDFNFITHSLHRPNLHHHVLKKTDEISQMMSIITRLPKRSPGLIYCNTKEKCKNISDFLNKNGFKADFFYSTISKKEKDRVLKGFLDGSIDIVVATSAFGTGINKPDCRFVINQDMPSSMNDLLQQIGRSGRDGLPSINYTFFSQADVQKLLFIFRQSISSADRLLKAKKKLDAVLSFCENKTECRSKLLLAAYGQQLESDCGTCDNCKRVKHK